MLLIALFALIASFSINICIPVNAGADWKEHNKRKFKVRVGNYDWIADVNKISGNKGSLEVEINVQERIRNGAKVVGYRPYKGYVFIVYFNSWVDATTSLSDKMNKMVGKKNIVFKEINGRETLNLEIPEGVKYVYVEVSNNYKTKGGFANPKDWPKYYYSVFGKYPNDILCWAAYRLD